MRKKGQIDLPVATLIEIIIVAVFVTLMFIRAAKEIDSHKFEKRYLAKDMSIFIDTLYASPNPLFIKYPQNTQDYSFVFKESKTIVLWQKESELLGESYYFSEDPNLEFGYKSILYNPEGSAIVEEGKEIQGIPILFQKTDKKIVPIQGILLQEKK
jgi:hypothetical protein